MNVGGLNIELMANLARLSSDLTSARGMLSNFAQSAQRSVDLVKGAFATLGVGLTVGGLALLFKNTTETIAKFKDLAQEVGSTASAMSRFEEPARKAGSSLDAVSNSIVRLSKAAIDARDPQSRAAQALNSIGISVERLKGLKPDEMFELVARQSVKYGDSIEKNAAIQELLGRSGKEMNRVFAEIADTQKLVATVTDEQAEAADRLGDQMVELQMNSEKLWRDLASKGVPALNAIMKAFMDARREGGLLNAVIAATSELFEHMAGNDLASQLKRVNTEIETAAANIRQLQQGGLATFFLSDPEKGRRMASLTDEMNGLLEKRANILALIAAAEKEATQATQPSGKPTVRYDPEAMKRLAAAEKERWDEAISGLKRYFDALGRADDLDEKLAKRIEDITQDVAVEIANNVGSAAAEGMNAFNASVEESARLWHEISDVAGSFFSDLVMNGKSAFDNLRRYVKQLLADMIALFAKRWVLQLAGVAGGGSVGSDSIAGGLLNQAGSWLGQTAIGGWASGVVGQFMGGLTGSIPSAAIGAEAVNAGVGINSGAAQAGSWLGALWWIAPIIAGMIANDRFFQQGWRADGQDGTARFTSAGVYDADRLLRGLGFNDRMASLISGSSLHTRLFGRGATHADAFGITGAVTSGGINAQTWQDFSQPGGTFRSDRRWTDMGALSGDQQNFLSLLFAAISGLTGQLSGHLGVNPAQALAGYSRDFNFQLNENGEPLSDEEIAALFNGLMGTVLKEQVAMLLDAGGKGELADYISNLKLEGDALIATITEFVQVMTAAPNFGLDIEAIMAMQRAGEGLSQTLTAVAQAQANYYSLFYTEEENLARNTEILQKQFKAMGLEMPTTREGFRQLVEGLDLSTEAGARLYRWLLEIAPAFADIVPPLEDVVDVVGDVADAAVAATVLIDAAMNQNVRPWEDIFGGYYASKPARSSLADNLRRSLMGTNSPLDPMQRLAAAQGEFDRLLALSQGGDVTAIGQLGGARDSLIEIARSIFGSSSAFVDIFNRTFDQAATIAEIPGINEQMLKIQTDALQYQAEMASSLRDSVEIQAETRDLLRDISRKSAPATADSWNER